MGEGYSPVHVVFLSISFSLTLLHQSVSLLTEQKDESTNEVDPFS